MPDQRWGLTLPFFGVPMTGHPELMRRAEGAGYDDLWSSEIAGPDGFTPLVLATAHTRAMRLATGVVNPFTRGTAVLAQHAAALADASGGRFVLGLGSSSDVIVERWNEIPFERPLSRMRRAVETLRPVLAGERGPGGFRLDAPPAEPVPIVVAALRGRMLALAAELGDGGFTNLLPVSGAAQVAEAFGAPGKELVCRYFAFPGPDEDGLAAARRLLLGYATVPVYAAFYDWLGWGERLEPVHAAWREGDRRRALELMPDDLVREVALLGPPEAQRERMDEFAAAGITTHVITPMGDPSGYGAQIDALRPVR